MGGVFHSMLTQGHVSFNRVLSTQRSYLGLIRSNGLRVFVDGPEGWQLLGLPSAFEMGPQHCRWIYACGTGREGRVIEVCSRANATPDRMQLQLRTWPGRRPCPPQPTTGPDRRRRRHARHQLAAGSSSRATVRRFARRPATRQRAGRGASAGPSGSAWARAAIQRLG